MCRNSFHIRAERKTGQLLKDTPKKSGARGIGKKVDSPAASPLADLGDAEAMGPVEIVPYRPSEAGVFLRIERYGHHWRAEWEGERLERTG